jgi:hypothetical protein
VATAENGFQHAYDIEPVPFGEWALRVAGRCALLGEPGVQVMGDPRQPVRRVGIGTGCLCRVESFQAMGCDTCMVSDDGTKYWSDLQYAEDAGLKIIRVNHGTCEEPGMATLTAYLAGVFPGVRWSHLPHACAFRIQTGA